MTEEPRKHRYTTFIYCTKQEEMASSFAIWSASARIVGETAAWQKVSENADDGDCQQPDCLAWVSLCLQEALQTIEICSALNGTFELKWNWEKTQFS